MFIPECIISHIGPSASPINVIIENIGKRNVTLRWSEPELEHHNGVIRNFIIHVAPREIWLESSKLTISYQLSYTVTNLHPFSRYSINVSAVTTMLGPNSTEVNVQTKEDGMPIVTQ